MPKIIISPELLVASGGRLTLGVVTARIVVKAKEEALWEELEESGRTLLARYQDKEAMAQAVGIKAVRETYKNLKTKAEHKGSNEALLKRIIEGKGLYQINTVVDANNLSSLEYLRSVGSYDQATLKGDIVFRAGELGEEYPATKKRALNLARIPILVDDLGPFGSPTSDSERALIRPTTRDIMTVIFSFDGRNFLDDQITNFVATLNDYAAAENVKTYIVSGAEPMDLHFSTGELVDHAEEEKDVTKTPSASALRFGM